MLSIMHILQWNKHYINNNPQGKRIRFSLNIVHDQNDPMSINIMAEDLLEEIFINLFSNSVKYTESSEVKIDVLIREYFIAEAKYWMITVSDYGKGIPDSMKKELFNRFYSKAKGSGLGLSIVKTLVERYKGKIWVGDRVYKDYKQGNYIWNDFSCITVTIVYYMTLILKFLVLFS